MIYLFYGTDLARSKGAAGRLAQGLLAKKHDATYVVIDSENFNQEVFEELLVAQGLFEHKAVVLIKDISSHKEGSVWVLEQIKNIAESPNIFIFAEPTGDLAKKLEKRSEKATEYTAKEVVTKERFNIFLLTDALARRDKKAAWILYYEALRKGQTPDEIEPMLFWQIKNLLLVKDHENNITNGPKETNLKPFVFNKTLSAAKYWQREELENILTSLVYLQRDARNGEEDLDIGLEKLILSV
jgi:DNA polymerase III delta subunit